VDTTEILNVTAGRVERTLGTVHWGHAAADDGVELAEACGVERVLLFHRDPSRTDTEVAALRDKVGPRSPVRVDIAREGDVDDL
jgi:ribonuclease BN (tRNA processing enzyme)